MQATFFGSDGFLQSLLARSHHRSACLQVVRDELVRISFNQLAINDPRFLNQHVAGFRERRRLKKNIPGRAPLARVSRRLTIAKVCRLIAVRFGFRFSRNAETNPGSTLSIT